MPEPLATLPNYMQAILDATWMVLLVIVLARAVGLRSFAKLTSFDFALTVATGSIIASVVVNPNHSVATGTAALGSVFFLQWAIATVRARLTPVHDAIRNTPVLLMRNGEIDPAALEATNMTRTDLYSKLRASGVANMSEVQAVVLETTGDVSVILARETVGPLDPELIGDVRRVGFGAEAGAAQT